MDALKLHGFSLQQASAIHGPLLVIEGEIGGVQDRVKALENGVGGIGRGLASAPAQINLLGSSDISRAFIGGILANPEKRTFWSATSKRFGRAKEADFTDAERAVIKSLTPGDSGLGAAMMPDSVAQDLYSLLSISGGAMRLGVVNPDTGNFKLANLTGAATAYWLTAANMGSNITSDATLAGAGVTGAGLTLAGIIDASEEVLRDGGNLALSALIEGLRQGLAYSLDWAAFSADGTNDTTDGGQTGIFAHGSVPIATAGAGNTTVAGLDVSDFTRTIGAVATSALQRACSWFINPVFLPALIGLRDGNERLLKPPTEFGGSWMLLGFPVVWIPAAPGTDGAGQKVAAFGRNDAYTVAIRRGFELMSARGQKFAQGIVQVRALTRARCVMRDATSLAILQTAAA